MQRRSTTRVVGRRQLDCPPLVLRALPHRIFPSVPFLAAQEQRKTGRQRDRLVLLGEEVCAVTTKLGKKPRGPLQLRENRSCQSYLHASMSLWYEGLLFEQRIHKFFRAEGQQIANFLAHADKSHREAQLARDGHNHATLRGAVEFGQH